MKKTLFFLLFSIFATIGKGQTAFTVVNNTNCLYSVTLEAINNGAACSTLESMNNFLVFNSGTTNVSIALLNTIGFSNGYTFGTGSDISRMKITYAMGGGCPGGTDVGLCPPASTYGPVTFSTGCSNCNGGNATTITETLVGGIQVYTINP